jgi:uncharacterized repeat protein (TIGR03803 family)
MSQMKPQKFSRTFAGFLTVFVVMIVFASAAFAVTPKETVLYHFKGSNDGAYPWASLVQDSAHNLYGTTANGGTSGFGTVFEVSPPGTAWTETVLYSFAGSNDGAYPYSDLTLTRLAIFMAPRSPVEVQILAPYSNSRLQLCKARLGRRRYFTVLPAGTTALIPWLA